MERYCRWLRLRLTAFQEEHGSELLRHCRGEVDFSHNNMSNHMVWLLLETLAQHEVHAALLKLFSNRISQGGVLAICEFIRMNERADAVQELHLSHNEIDDDSVLELLRTLHFNRPRYPPQRLPEGSGSSFSTELVLAPVWLRLNHNRVRDPETVRQKAEAEGITICTALDRNGCGTTRCCRRECPLVHLYSFNVQARPHRARREGREQPTLGAPGARTAAAPVQRAPSDSGEEVQQPARNGLDGDGDRDRRREYKRERKGRRHRERGGGERGDSEHRRERSDRTERDHGEQGDGDKEGREKEESPEGVGGSVASLAGHQDH